MKLTDKQLDQIKSKIPPNRIDSKRILEYGLTISKEDMLKVCQEAPNGSYFSIYGYGEDFYDLHLQLLFSVPKAQKELEHDLKDAIRQYKREQKQKAREKLRLKTKKEKEFLKYQELKLKFG